MLLVQKNKGTARSVGEGGGATDIGKEGRCGFEDLSEGREEDAGKIVTRGEGARCFLLGMRTADCQNIKRVKVPKGGTSTTKGIRGAPPAPGRKKGSKKKKS